MARASISLHMKQRNASPSVQTMGSPRTLTLVFIPGFSRELQRQAHGRAWNSRSLRAGQSFLFGTQFDPGDAPQGKLVRAVTGEALDIAVDLRLSSATSGMWRRDSVRRCTVILGFGAVSFIAGLVQ